MPSNAELVEQVKMMLTKCDEVYALGEELLEALTLTESDVQEAPPTTKTSKAPAPKVSATPSKKATAVPREKVIEEFEASDPTEADSDAEGDIYIVKVGDLQASDIVYLTDGERETVATVIRINKDVAELKCQEITEWSGRYTNDDLEDYQAQLVEATE